MVAAVLVVEEEEGDLIHQLERLRYQIPERIFCALALLVVVLLKCPISRVRSHPILEAGTNPRDVIDFLKVEDVVPIESHLVEG